MIKSDCIDEKVEKGEKVSIITQNRSRVPRLVEISKIFLTFINGIKCFFGIKCVLLCLKNDVLLSRGSIVSAAPTNLSASFRRLSSFLAALLLITLSSLVFLPADSISAGNFWEEQLSEAEAEIEAGGDSLLVHYKKAVSKANLGEVQRTEEFVNEKKNDNSNIEERLAEELEPFLKEAEAGSEDLLSLNYAAFFYSIKEDYKKSLEYFDRLTELDEENIWPYTYKATILIGEFEDFDRGHEVLDAALEIEDNDVIHLLRGYAYYGQERYLRALNSLRRGRGSLDEVEQFF